MIRYALIPYFYRMHKSIAISLIIAMIWGCDGSQETAKQQEVQTAPKEVIAKDTVKSTPLPPPPPPPDLINDQNVREKLLAYGKENPETIVLIHTSKGKIKCRLYKDTPLHRANFILLAKKGYYDGSIFTRVAENFIAQGGGTFSEEKMDIKNSIGRYTIPAEIKPHHYHKKGALAAARRYEDNPRKRSDPRAFYFVEGSTYNDLTLDAYEEQNGYKYSQAQRAYYKSNPGAAHIDGEHTVFGEIISGFSVIPKITHVKTDSRDWPVKDIVIEKVEVLQ